MKEVTSTKWLVTPPEGVPFTAALTAACKGHDKTANLLNYFLVLANSHAKKYKINEEETEFIELTELRLDKIVAGLTKQSKAESKTTLHKRITDLVTYGYLVADGYGGIYRVYFHKVQEAVNNPPPADAPKLRGRHVARLNNPDLPLEDRSFKSKVKSVICDDEITDLRNKITLLTSQITDLTFEKSKLTSEMSNLTSSLSYEVACRQALEAKVDALYLKDTYKDTLLDTSNDVEEKNTAIEILHTDLSPAPVEAPRHITLVSTYDPEQKASKRRSSKKIDYKAPVQQFLPTPPVVVPAPALLTEAEQTWFDEIYSKCKINNVPPRLNAKVAEKVKILCLHIHTVEEADKLFDWSCANKWEGVKEVNIHVMATLLNGFLQAQTKAQPTPAGNVAHDMTLRATMTRNEAEQYMEKLLEIAGNKYPNFMVKVMSKDDAWCIRVQWAEKRVSNILSGDAFERIVAAKLDSLDTQAAAAKEAM